MFEISQEISREFSPIVSNSMPEPIRPDKLQNDARARTAWGLERIQVLSRLPGVTRIELSSQELLEISLEITAKYSPRFACAIPEVDNSRIKLSAQEILAISEEITREFAPKLTVGKSEIVLLPVDPYHLHAYWRLDESEFKDDQEPEQALTLRIYPEPNGDSAEFETEAYLDVVIAGSQGQQNIVLPASGHVTRYSAAIGKNLSGQDFTAYIRSNIIRIPRTSTEDYPCLENKHASGGGLFLHKHASGQGK
ncbi:MAG: DUF4912 domain-containing protein [Gammaproteobacteria bacterium]